MSELTQFEVDIEELADAFAIGGESLARRVFNAIVEARGLVKWQALVLVDMARARAQHAD